MKLIFCFFLLPLLAKAENVKMLTWNLFLIPPPINHTYQEQRASHIASHLAETQYDFFFFQETFHKSSRKILIEGLSRSHPFYASPTKGKKFLSIMGSGLMVFSKYPFDILDEVVFDACSGGLVGDCRARKGAFMVEISLPNNRFIQVINTHMQAWDNEKAIKVRKSQLRQIKEMLTRHKKENIPQVLVGDINIDGYNEKELSEGLEILQLITSPLQGEIKHTNGFPTPCYKNPGGETRGQWLDHILHEGNLNISAKVVPIMGKLKVKDKRQNGTKTERECSFSDHYAVEGIISFKANEANSEDKD